MIKLPDRTLTCAILLFFSLGYPLTSLAALVLKADAGDKLIILRWTPINGTTNYGVCYATEAIADINNCLNYTDGTWLDMTNTTVKITQITNGKKYYARVLAETAIKTLGISNSVAIVPFKPALNDTGITTCSTGFYNDLPCPVKTYPNQDAQFGRDVTESKNKNGHAGFNFSKISKTGATLSVSALNWGCVKDNVTGLVWEIKTDDNSLHDKDWTYTGGSRPYDSCGKTSVCTTDAFVKAVNAVGWCGYTDWRLPSKAEMYSIIDYGKYNPAIDTTFFPNTTNGVFHTSNGYVNFVSGSTEGAPKVYVRLVRNGL